MDSQIARFYSDAKQLTFRTTPSTTDGFGMNVFAGGMLYITAGSGNLTFYVKYASDSSTTFLVADPGAVIAVAPGSAYPLPDCLYGATHVLPVASVGTITAYVTLKG